MTEKREMSVSKSYQIDFERKLFPTLDGLAYNLEITCGMGN